MFNNNATKFKEGYIYILHLTIAEVTAQHKIILSQNVPCVRVPNVFILERFSIKRRKPKPK